MKSITVVGLGYMGLPTALLIARSGLKVYGYDTDKKKIKLLRQGELPFKEPGLADLYNEARHNFNPIENIHPSDVFILALPTPINQDKTCDISFVISALNSIVPVIENDNLIILESTVSPGTTIGIVENLIKKSRKKILLSYVSEKALPGNTLNEMQNNHRIIGGINTESTKRTLEVYQKFVKAPIHLTDCTTAECVKLIENTYRDVNIALANELALRLSEIGVNAWEAINLANLHPRVNVHQPGPGVGGHCLAVDPWFLENKDTPLIGKARQINDGMPLVVVGLIERILKGSLDKIIVLLGVAYKGNIDDDRESPSYKIKKILESKGHTVRLYDPLMRRKNDNIISNLSKATKDANCLVLITDHAVFKDIDPRKITNMQSKIILDTRNFLPFDKWEKAGFFVTILGA